MSYFTAQDGVTLISRKGYGGGAMSGLSGVLDTIGDFLSGAAKSAVSIYNANQQQQGATAALQTALKNQSAASKVPSWVMPVAVVGGLGLVAAVVLKKRRRNPARRYRRNRAGSGAVYVGRPPLVPRRRRKRR